jgi:cell division protein FtsN
MKSKFLLFAVTLCIACFFSACKSKQSAYKSAYERAREKERSTTETATPPAAVIPAAPVYTPRPVPAEAEVKKEKVVTVAGSGLKRFGVVIGSFELKANAVSLKERMEAEGYNVVVAKNEIGMYRIIIASYDLKADAANARDQIKAKYAPTYADAWLLEQQY